MRMINAKKIFFTIFNGFLTDQIQINSASNMYDVNVPLKLSIIKPIHGKWLLGLYDHLKSSPTLIIQKFEMAGIKKALEIKLPSGDPFADLD